MLPAPEQIFTPDIDFEARAAEVWAFQARHNPTVRRFCDLLGTEAQQFIPIRFFKEFPMRTAPPWTPELTFRSSGTTGQVTSLHEVRDASIYRQALLKGFWQFYSEKSYKVFALLPNYLERAESSLVHMVKVWIEEFGLPGSGFYLYDHDALRQALAEAMDARAPILLIGVSFALLDFVEGGALRLPSDAIVMETGGMKGRRKELTRADLHATLKAAFGVPVHSEYGMTELLSQAYMTGNGGFRCPPWMRVVITDPSIPGKVLPAGITGRINIIDLANLHSCSFIRTDDLGRLHADGSFDVLGRMDTAELRGCNLMVL